MLPEVAEFFRREGIPPCSMDGDLIADSIAAENVRRLLRGEIIGEPEPGTLAWRVWNRARDCAARRRIT